jgi:hypothetical protein
MDAIIAAMTVIVTFVATVTEIAEIVAIEGATVTEIAEIVAKEVEIARLLSLKMMCCYL